MNHADLSNANLSYANLIDAKLRDLKGLETANLNNVFSNDPEFQKIVEKRQSSKLIKKLKCILNNDKKEKVHGLKEFSQAIKVLKKILLQDLEVSDDSLDRLVEIAFILSFKKEESRYPKFHLYVPEKNGSSSESIVNFKNKIRIDLSNLATLTRLGLGTQQSCALIIEKEIEEEKSNLVSKGIIKIESDAIHSDLTSIPLSF